ncbi:probable amidase At4g34880 isoform X1 [Mangifera indica]|uniref:probable amidase At4g34880 isoform X1 n=1 Tax=Mangifera indica TaxID=29780 RepID=UPI001CFA4117|nr:probable amidase At4g34880 isoform X1 [Mangifera indica]
MATNAPYLSFSLVFLALLSSGLLIIVSDAFSVEEATIKDLQLAFKQNQLTSRTLVEFYLGEIHKLNQKLRGVIEVNPDALRLAEKADQERKSGDARSKLGLHGIPILLKDNIATKDKMNTTAGSFALLGSIVPREAFVVTQLIKSGAIILGKASMSEWAGIRDAPTGWCARSGQGKNPYLLSAEPCGSSSGSAISVASNMAAVSLGTETDGSILCPSAANSVVGIKPTIGLTSRDGVVPLSPRQDTVGPICRTVADAVYVLDAIVGFDHNDKATREASKHIPRGGYKQFLKPDGLKRKRLGIVRHTFSSTAKASEVIEAFERHIQTLREQGAIVVENLEIANIDQILDPNESGENYAMLTEFKMALNTYLKGLKVSPVRSLKDVIAFNKKFSKLENITEYGQGFLEAAQATNGTDYKLKAALSNLKKLSRDGLEKLMKEEKLDAVITPDVYIATVLAIGGFPGITVPAGYSNDGYPFGIYFGGLKGSEPSLIEIAYGFEQATKIRKPPSFKP